MVISGTSLEAYPNPAQNHPSLVPDPLQGACLPKECDCCRDAAATQVIHAQAAIAREPGGRLICHAQLPARWFATRGRPGFRQNNRPSHLHKETVAKARLSWEGNRPQLEGLRSIPFDEHEALTIEVDFVPVRGVPPVQDRPHIILPIEPADGEGYHQFSIRKPGTEQRGKCPTGGGNLTHPIGDSEGRTRRGVGQPTSAA